MNTKKRSLLMFIMSFMLMAALLVACDNDTNNGTPGAGGGLGDETPVGGVDTDLTPIVTDDSLIETETPIMIETETPMMVETNTPVVVETSTPMMEMTATIDSDPVDIATAVPTDTVDIDPTGTMTETNVILATDLVGMNITNDADEDVGEVSEVLVDEEGNIHYIVFDAGGFLGVDERTTAIRWDAFDAPLPLVNDDTGLMDERTIRFTGLTTDLETAPQLDMADLEQDGFLIDAEEWGLLDSDNDRLLQLSEFSGVFDNDFNLINTNDEDLGEVEDAVLDLHEGRVLYAVVDFGGFLGIGENTVAVPWQRLEFNEENEQFILDIADVSLEDAPTLDLGLFTDDNMDMRDPDWDGDIREYWGIHNDMDTTTDS